jgi:O-antigen/teichoic acid export membrane protein
VPTTTTTLESPPETASAPTRPPRANPVRNVFWIWAGLVANIAISFFMAPFVVRSLGEVYYGIWALLSQFTGYLWLLDFGVRESVIKYVAEYDATGNEEQLNTTVHAAVSLYSAISAIVMFVVAAMTFGLPYLFKIPPDSVSEARLALLITGGTIAQGFVFNVYVGVLMGIQRFYLVDRMGIILAVPRAILTVILLRAGYGIVALAGIQFTISLAGNLWVYHLCRVDLPYLSFRLAKPKREDLRRVVDYGKYVLLNNLGEKLVYASDGLVVGAFLPISNLTYYAIPSTLIGYLKAFVVGMASVLIPMSSALDSTNDKTRLRELFLSGAKASMIVGLPVCIGFIVLGERFIGIWMGAQFSPMAGQVLRVLGTAHLVGLPYYTIAGVLYGLAQPGVIARMRIFEAVVNLGLSVLLVQRYGVLGVAIGTLVPHVIVAVVFLPGLMPKLLPVGLREYYVSTYVWPLMASLPFWITCLLIDRMIQPSTLVSFITIGTLSLVVYLVPTWFLALDPAERALVRGRFARPARARAAA